MFTKVTHTAAAEHRQRRERIIDMTDSEFACVVSPPMRKVYDTFGEKPVRDLLRTYGVPEATQIRRSQRPKFVFQLENMVAGIPTPPAQPVIDFGPAVSSAKKDALEVFKDSCNHTHDAIEYFASSVATYLKRL